MAIREILFRGKLKNGKWAEGNLAVTKTGTFVITPDETLCGYYGAVQPDTIGQYTGLTDKAGIKAFEHDCIHGLGKAEIGVIRYGKYRNTFNSSPQESNIGFYVEWVSGECKDIYRKDLGYWLNFTEIIGNIHDNPELLPLCAENGGTK